jgi:hypothetical protein
MNVKVKRRRKARVVRVWAGTSELEVRNEVAEGGRRVVLLKCR